jgi:hypothetical protein
MIDDDCVIVTRWSGREKLHYLNVVPIRLIHDRWIDKYMERRVSALADLKADLEAQAAHKTKHENAHDDRSLKGWTPMKTILFAPLLCAAAVVSVTSERHMSATKMEQGMIGKPAAEMEKLKYMLGTWSCEPRAPSPEPPSP